MNTKIVEATQNIEGGMVNHGKFLVGRFDVNEYGRRDFMGANLIIPRWGQGTHGHILVLDLETGEGALFMPGGYVKADLNKHRIWVCPLFQPFLEYLYGLDRELHIHVDRLPDIIELPDAPFQMQGYRRPGPEGAE